MLRIFDVLGLLVDLRMLPNFMLLSGWSQVGIFNVDRVVHPCDSLPIENPS